MKLKDDVLKEHDVTCTCCPHVKEDCSRHGCPTIGEVYDKYIFDWRDNFKKEYCI